MAVSCNKFLFRDLLPDGHNLTLELENADEKMSVAEFVHIVRRQVEKEPLENRFRKIHWGPQGDIEDNGGKRIEDGKIICQDSRNKVKVVFLQEYDLVAKILAYDLPILDSLTPVVFDIDLGSPMDFSEPVFEAFFFRMSPHDVDKLRHRHLFVGVLHYRILPSWTQQTANGRGNTMILYCKACIHTKFARINACSEFEFPLSDNAMAQDKLWHSAIATNLRSVTSTVKSTLGKELFPD